MLLGIFQIRPQATTKMDHLTRFFFYFFSKDVINHAFLQAHGLFARQKGASPLQGGLPFTAGNRNETQEESILLRSLCLKESPRESSKDLKTTCMTWLLKKEILQQHSRNAKTSSALCNQRSSLLWDLFVELREMAFKKWLSEWEQSGTFFLLGLSSMLPSFKCKGWI